jgi:hypothetical protein
MNRDFPPLPFAAFEILKRKTPKGFPPTSISAEERVAAAKRARAFFAEAATQFRRLSPEQKRAVFLKMTHDRPLVKADLAGSGLTFFNTPGKNETLLIPRKTEHPGFEAQITRFDNLANGTEKKKSLGLASHMTGLTLAEPQERLCETFRRDYAKLAKKRWFVYEIEISSFATHPATKRKEIGERLGKLKHFLTSGSIYEHDDNQIEEGVVRVVVSSSGVQFKQLVENLEWRCVITCFDERPQFETFHTRYKDFNIGDTTVIPPPENAPKICVIDSGVAAGNPFLAPVVDRELSKSFIADFEPLEDATGHGSGVASLAAYHVIDITKGGRHEAIAKIVSSRITNDNGQLDVVEEQDDGVCCIKTARLLSKTLEEIVNHYAPLGVKIFVLSYSILGHVWSKANQLAIRKRTWLARTIDRLVKQHDVFFVGVTGNIDAQEVAGLHKQQPYPAYFTNPLAKLLDPAQASLAVIAGSVAHSAEVVTAQHITAIAQVGRGSPFTRSGPGFGGAVKPDFVERGGNFVIDSETGKISKNAGTNVVMASGKLTPVLQLDVGTSFAAPRIAFHAAKMIADFREQFGQEPSACLLRAMLAVSAQKPAVSSLNKPDLLALYGHGQPDGVTATTCSPASVLLFSQEEIEPNKVILFPVFVPVSIVQSGTAKKRISVAVAVAPIVQSWGTQNYTSVKMKFRMFRGDKALEEIRAKIAEVEEAEENADSPMEEADDLKSSLGVNLRSVGTLQSDVFEWTVHAASYSQQPYTLAVSVQAAEWNRGGVKDSKIPFAVVVRIEDTSERCNTLYSEVKTCVEAQAQARIRT